MVFKDMESFFGFHAFNGNTGAHHFAESVNIDGIHIQLSFNFFPHIFRPRLCTEIPALKCRSLNEIPISSAASARWRAYEGVAVKIEGLKSLMIMAWRLVLPPETGMTDAPNFSAP